MPRFNIADRIRTYEAGTKDKTLGFKRDSTQKQGDENDMNKFCMK